MHYMRQILRRHHPRHTMDPNPNPNPGCHDIPWGYHVVPWRLPRGFRWYHPWHATAPPMACDEILCRDAMGMPWYAMTMQLKIQILYHLYCWTLKKPQDIDARPYKNKNEIGVRDVDHTGLADNIWSSEPQGNEVLLGNAVETKETRTKMPYTSHNTWDNLEDSRGWCVPSCILVFFFLGLWRLSD